MNFSVQEIKKYEKTDTLVKSELAKQGIPNSVLKELPNIINEADIEASDLINENRAAFFVVLLAKAYNEGRIHGINEEQARRTKNN